jgi:hypothetical protein
MLHTFFLRLPPRSACGRSGEPRQVRGITMGGVPVGKEDYETEWMARRGATVAGYITSTREQLRHLPGHLWAILFYCLQSRLDYWLRLLPTDITCSAAHRRRSTPHCSRR